MAGDEFQVVAPADGSKALIILIVEDEAMVASYISDVLSESGFCVAGIAASAREALSLAAETHPSLALVDIGLTGPTDGVELACLLRQRLGVPTIFLSGRLDDINIERARMAEPLGFLAKPFLPSQVFNAIERAVAQLGG